MLLNDLIVKCSSFLASLVVVHGPPDQTTPQQSPLRMPSDSGFNPSTSLMLSDVLTVQTSASIFYSYARETHVGELLKQKDARITVFAPANKAVMALVRKPHQGPVPVDDTVISQEEFDSLSRENVERWISAHIVPEALPNLSPSSKYETLLGDVSITVDRKSETKESDGPNWQEVVLNGNISVVDRAEAANGILYLLDGALYG